MRKREEEEKKAELDRLRPERSANTGKLNQSAHVSSSLQLQADAKKDPGLDCPSLPAPAAYIGGEEAVPQFDLGREREKEMNSVPCI